MLSIDTIFTKPRNLFGLFTTTRTMKTQHLPSICIFIQVGIYMSFAINVRKVKENYSLSGHGYENSNVSFVLPRGVTLNFYVNYGEILPVYKGHSISEFDSSP